jgi:KilA-N domain
MAKPFDAQIVKFMQTESTKNFISACLNSANMHYLNIQTEDDLYPSKQKTGTFMHRVLALKFAAWLNPDFELWVYRTIESVIMGKVEQAGLVLLNAEKKERKLAELREQELRYTLEKASAHDKIKETKMLIEKINKIQLSQVSIPFEDIDFN